MTKLNLTKEQIEEEFNGFTKNGTSINNAHYLTSLLQDWLTMYARILELEEKIDKRDKYTYCAYCGKGYLIKGKASPLKITEHIKNCEKHPLKIEIDRLHNSLREAKNELLKEGNPKYGGITDYTINKIFDAHFPFLKEVDK